MDHAQRMTAPLGGNQPFSLRLLLKAARHLRVGKLRIVAPDGASFSFEGSEPGPAATFIIRNLGSVRRLLLGGDLGLAEAYMDNLWETPDLMALLELGQRNTQSLRETEQAGWPQRALNSLVHALRRNTRKGARRNIAYHYDLGNGFYELWLDESLTYSSAIFAEPGQTLGEAQRNKYHHMLQRLQLESGHQLLEIGSGWGGFAIYAAQQTGCRVTSITLSEQQLKEAQARAAAAGVADRVRFELRDYRDVREQYDRIVSIEMFEAVGEHYWDAFFKTVHACLKPAGRAAIQVIIINDVAFPVYRRTVDFIQRYIFPGGILPCPSAWEQCVHRAGLRTESREFYGQHYARTLKLWEGRVQAAHYDILNLGFDERFLRMWHYYLAYCHAGFITSHVDVMQTTILRDD